MDDKMEFIDFSLPNHIAQKLTALCAITGETLEEKIASILEEMLGCEGKIVVVPASCDGHGDGDRASDC